MREIKFRAWDKKNNIIIQEPTISIFGDIASILEKLTIPMVLKSNSHYELMQYIGLKDKNGKEIYEGDILQISNHWDWGDKKKEVKFMNGCYYPFGTGDWEPDNLS